MQDFVFTSTSVSEGHPDKLCDRISDALVDKTLARDPTARILAECAVAPGVVFVSAQRAGAVEYDITSIVRDVIGEAGYAQGDFTASRVAILTSLGTLSPAAPRDVEDPDAVRASNNVTLFGYACAQSPTCMPLPVSLAHALMAALDTARRSGTLAFIHPDGQAQVAIEYRGRRPVRIAGVTLVAARLEREAGPPDFREALLEAVVLPVLRTRAGLPFDLDGLVINPTGEDGGGPARHAGLTGRKTGADCYGEFSRHAGSALSGKDPWRIDRTGSYAARHAAKTVVAAGLARECEVQLTYSMGLAAPASIEIDTFGTGTRPDRAISSALRHVFDFRPAAIVRRFGLADLPRLRGGRFFEQLAAYGHMGREDHDAPWERRDQVDALIGAL